MSRIPFYASPGYLKIQSAVIGSVVTLVAMVMLVGGVRYVFAETNFSGNDETNASSGNQSPEQNRMPSQPRNEMPGLQLPDSPNERQDRSFEQPNGQQPPSFFPGQDPGSREDRFDNRRNDDPSSNNGEDSGRDEEEQRKMEARQKEMEARQHAQDEQNVKRMKQGVTQMSSMIKRVTTRMARMEKSGIPISDDLRMSLDTLTKDVNLLLNATSMEDEGVQDALSDLQEKGSDIQNGIAELQRLSQAASLLKQANRQIKLLDVSLARVQKMAKTSKVDVSAQVEALAQADADMKASLQKAKDAFAQGDGETALQTVQDDVFGKLQDLMQIETLVRALQNVRSNITRFDAFIARSQKTVTKMEKAGKDVEEARSALEQMRTSLDELKQKMTEKDLDPGDLFEAMNAVYDAQNSVQEALGQSSSARMPTGNGDLNEMKDFQSFQNVVFPSFGEPSTGGDSFKEPALLNP